MTSIMNHNQSNIMFQAVALNKMLLRLTIEQTEDEILSFENALTNAINHPEELKNLPLDLIKDKFKKLNQLQCKLAELG